MHCMESQITLRLPENLAADLDRAAKRMRRKRSEILRLALEQYLSGAAHTDEKPFDRMAGLVGSVESGIVDLGERHREYLTQRLRHGR